MGLEIGVQIEVISYNCLTLAEQDVLMGLGKAAKDHASPDGEDLEKPGHEGLWSPYAASWRPLVSEGRGSEVPVQEERREDLNRVTGTLAA